MLKFEDRTRLPSTCIQLQWSQSKPETCWSNNKTGSSNHCNGSETKLDKKGRVVQMEKKGKNHSIKWTKNTEEPFLGTQIRVYHMKNQLTYLVQELDQSPKRLKNQWQCEQVSSILEN